MWTIRSGQQWHPLLHQLLLVGRLRHVPVVLAPPKADAEMVVGVVTSPSGSCELFDDGCIIARLAGEDAQTHLRERHVQSFRWIQATVQYAHVLQEALSPAGDRTAAALSFAHASLVQHAEQLEMMRFGCDSDVRLGAVGVCSHFMFKHCGLPQGPFPSLARLVDGPDDLSRTIHDVAVIVGGSEDAPFFGVAARAQQSLLMRQRGNRGADGEGGGESCTFPAASTARFTGGLPQAFRCVSSVKLNSVKPYRQL